jgi:hypothetical protein
MSRICISVLIGLLMCTSLSAKTVVRVTAATGAVFSGTSVAEVREGRVLVNDTSISTSLKELSKETHYEWATAATLGIAFWLSESVKCEECADDSAQEAEDRFTQKVRIGLGFHLITTINQERESFAPGIGVHVGIPRGAQFFVGLRLAPSNDVLFQDGRSSIQVPIDTDPSLFIEENSASRLNFFLGFVVAGI